MGEQDISPRPWACSGVDRRVEFCTHHGDCTCIRAQPTAALCPIHGVQTDHPFPQPVLKPPRGIA